MKPKFKDFSLPITGRRYQILYDPDCPDVTYDELKIFVIPSQLKILLAT